MRRICVVITARPSYSRIRSALLSLRQRSNVELQIIACASALVTRFGRVVDRIREDGFVIDAEVESVVDSDTPAGTALSTGLLLTQLAGLFQRLKPTTVVTIADRHETLATAIAASYQNIEVCHVQGGERTGSVDDRVRNAVTQIADVHCVSTELAKHTVGGMIGTRGQIVKTGCPSIDLARDAKAMGPLPSRPVIVLQHPVSDEVENAGFQMQETIRALSGMDVTYFWPGEEAGNGAMAKELRLAGLHPIRNLAPRDFLRTLLGAKVVVGNSSVGIRECSYLGVPVVNLGTRQNGRERAENVIDLPHQAEAIRWGVLEQMDKRFPESKLYGDGYAGERIADVLSGVAKERVA